MLFHTLAEPGSGVYVEQYTCTLRGALRPDVYREAWERTIARHPVLRTSFLWEGLDQPVQVVRQTVDLPWTNLDWSDNSSDNRSRQLEAFLRDDRVQGFELATAPLMRMTLIRTGGDTHQLVWSFHHILLDGWSTALVLDEVMAEYRAQAQGQSFDPPTRAPYRDYIAWRQGQDLSSAEAFWHHELAGFDTPTPLPLAGRTGDTGRVDQQEAQLSETETNALRQFARQHRLTLNTVLQGAWALLLSRMSGEDDVVYGTTVAGRPAALPGVEAMVGAFLNTLPMRVAVESDALLADWLQSVQTKALAVREHEHTPLSQIQRWSEVRGGRSLFDSLLVFENYPITESESTLDLVVEDADYREQSNYPLALLVVPGSSLRLILVYDTARFNAEAIARLLGTATTLLRAMVASPDARVGELAILSEVERAECIAAAVGPDLPALPEGGVLEWIEAHVRDTPDAVAVTCEGERLTYAQLWSASGALAAHLQSLDVGPDVPVGLCAERSRQLVVGLVGILRAGGAYVPMDPGYPEDRIRHTLADAEAPVLVTHGRHLRTFANSTATLVDLDAVHSGGTLELAMPSSEGLAYILYTSGSTGQPKGVAVTHGNLAASTGARLEVYDAPVGRFLLLSSVAFDSSVAGLFWTLATGGALVIPPARIEQDVDALAALIEREQVTHTLCLPSLYNVLLELMRPGSLASLQCVIAAGEALPPAVAESHLDRLPNVALHNEYGPTEATVWATVHPVTAPVSTPRVPIGQPIPGARVYVLDARGEPVPVGVPGELVIGGAGVAQGYWNRQDLTDAAFEPDPLAPESPARRYRTGDRAQWRADGTLDILGRVDTQVKIRGYRVELGEVEAALRQHPDVREAVAIVRSTGAQPDNALADDVEALAARLTALPPDRAERLLADLQTDDDHSTRLAALRGSA